MIHILTSTYRTIDPLFGREQGTFIELDLGCGKGSFSLDLAERFPERLILSVDIMIGRMRKVANKARAKQLSNIDFLRADSFELAGFQIPDNSIDRIHLLCPDPWPKSRHRTRRLITIDFIHRLSRILKSNGTFHVATDHPPYRETLKRVMQQLPAFEKDASLIEDISDLKTDFERLWLEQGKSVPHSAYRIHKTPLK